MNLSQLLHLEHLHLNQRDQVNGNELEVKTNNPLFKLSGVVNDNLDGYRLYVNGNNI